MIVEKRILDFEKLGFGMFVHFGLYSQLGKGEWALKCLGIPQAEYDRLAETFCPDPQWAKSLASAAKQAGCKYITITTRHHDGYSLYDTCGLSAYDAPHSCGRDLIREFVDACREEELIPFFYHTLIDWREKTCPFHSDTHPEWDREGDWEAYMEYLQKSVELLCTNYGPIGGLWFDGMWAYWNNDWQEDKLYGLIRSHQPQAMIINNTGLDNMGQLGHIELDSVTFERGKPQPLNLEDSPKYIASEMCEVFNAHWGYAENDLFYKSPASLIETLAECRRYGANLLMNVGPMGNGLLRPIDACCLELMGRWVKTHDEAIRLPRPTDISVENRPRDFLLKEGSTYYLFCLGLPMRSDPNVQRGGDDYFRSAFHLDAKIKSACWMDSGEPVKLTQEGSRVSFYAQPFAYGTHGVVRVAKLETE